MTWPDVAALAIGLAPLVLALLVAMVLPETPVMPPERPSNKP